MGLDGIRALTFDTGGTILDWHSGFRAALAEAGEGIGEERDWGALANEIRRGALKRMLNLGKGRVSGPAVERGEKPPHRAVMLIHGDQDAVVPFTDMAKAGDTLVAAGFPTYGHVMKGTGHGIAPDGLGAALQFIQQVLE